MRLLLLLLFILKFGDVDAQIYSSFIDARDGRKYKTVKIGNQVWMAENLNATTFRNGDTIREALSETEWLNARDVEHPIQCFYEYDEENGKKYGRIYNGYTVFDQRGIAPKGWRIPNNDDWVRLFIYLGGEKIAGGKMKNKVGWMNYGWNPSGKNKNLPPANGSNSSGFSALPGGYIDCSVNSSNFMLEGKHGHWWSSTVYNMHYAWGYLLSNGGNDVIQIFVTRWAGMYIRCIKE